MRQLSLHQVAECAGIALTGNSFFTGYAVDSRQVQPGNLFFALKGEKTDGHAFLKEAAAAGAAAVVVTNKEAALSLSIPSLAVEDSLALLQTLARYVLSLKRQTIVAVTGSVGKTTTKGFLHTLLRARYRVSASEGNQNSQIGLPLTILNHTSVSDEVLVLEMGMTQSGHIRKLIQIAPPDIALLTAVELVHAGYFANLNAIGRAKAEIFESPQTRLGLLPRSLPNFTEIASIGACPKKSYAVEGEADYTLRAENTLFYLRDTAGETPLGSFSLKGTHNRHNLLAALSVARYLGLTPEELTCALPELKLPPKRFEWVEKQGILFINDSYNAPPVGVKAALDNLPLPKLGGKTIAVLGPMPDLGTFSETCHREIATHALARADLLLCLGKECEPMVEVWQKAGRPVEWYAEREELAKRLHAVACARDVVLIKGENTRQMWQLLEVD